jgi:hypothetical protein
MVETLPGAEEENIESSIRNLEGVEKNGLRSYLDLDGTQESFPVSFQEPAFRDMEKPLGRIFEECIQGLGEDFRYSKTPFFKCSCGIDKVWSALRLMGQSDIEDIVSEGDGSVEMTCEFCGEEYRLTKEEITKEVLSKQL